MRFKVQRAGSCHGRFDNHPFRSYSNSCSDPGYRASSSSKGRAELGWSATAARADRSGRSVYYA
eukprot:683333-Pyramimonas_sp.AAC.1